MVWKSDFFSGFMRFVRVPPYENWAFWTNFYFSWENGEFFWGQTCCTLFHTKNEEKSQKISTCIRIHTRVYAITWRWGQICPPPGLIGLKGLSLYCVIRDGVPIYYNITWGRHQILVQYFNLEKVIEGYNPFGQNCYSCTVFYFGIRGHFITHLLGI